MEPLEIASWGAPGWWITLESALALLGGSEETHWNGFSMRRSVPGCPRPLRGGSTCLATPLGNTVCQSSCVGPASPSKSAKQAGSPLFTQGPLSRGPPPGANHTRKQVQREGRQWENKKGKKRRRENLEVGLKGLRDILSQGRFAFQGQEFVSVWADSWLNYEDSWGHAFHFQRITWPWARTVTANISEIHLTVFSPVDKSVSFSAAFWPYCHWEEEESHQIGKKDDMIIRGPDSHPAGKGRKSTNRSQKGAQQREKAGQGVWDVGVSAPQIEVKPRFVGEWEGRKDV